MDKEKLDELWKILSSTTNIDKLEYDEAVTIGSVFGQMRNEIERQQKEIAILQSQLEQLQKDYDELDEQAEIWKYESGN